MIALDTGSEDQVQSLSDRLLVSGPFRFLLGALMGALEVTVGSLSSWLCGCCSLQPWSTQEAVSRAWALHTLVKASLVFQGV